MFELSPFQYIMSVLNPKEAAKRIQFFERQKLYLQQEDLLR